MLNVYKEVAARLRVVAPMLKDVERYFAQLDLEALGRYRPIVFPAAYFELVNIRTTSRGELQDCDGILRLRLCDRALNVDQLRTLKVEEAVYFGLAGWQGDTLMTGLDRVDIQPDPKFTGTEVLVVDYAIKWTDRRRKDHGKTTVPGGSVTPKPEFRI